MSPEHKALVDALTALAASMIRGDADPEVVQKFVDAELTRIEAKLGDFADEPGDPTP
jgi:hypothetical protein